MEAVQNAIRKEGIILRRGYLETVGWLNARL